MANVPTIEVSEPVLKSMFRKYGIWKKIKSRQISRRVIQNRPSTRWPRSSSQIILHVTPQGKHIATTHRVIRRNGQVVHWDARNIRLGGVCYWIA